MIDDDLKNDVKIAEGLTRKRLLNAIQKLAQQTTQVQQPVPGNNAGFIGFVILRVE